MRSLKELTYKRRIFLLIILLLVAFATWFLIRILTIDTSLILIDDYRTPELVSLKDNNKDIDENFAISIDGNIVDTSSKQNEPIAQPTASTAKMILGLAIMKAKPFNEGSAGEIITLTEDDYDRYLWYLNNGGSVTAVKSGEEISQYDALMSVFLASSNNMADSLAIWAFGSIENYRSYATEMLEEWRINHTTLGDDASGFSETTTSTADDLARLGEKVLNNAVLREIVGTEHYLVPVAGDLTNTNGLLGQSGIIGIKTGYIGDTSGYCLVSGYIEGSHIVTLALLDADTRQDSFSKSLKIIIKMQNIVKYTKLVNNQQVVGHYDSWWTGRVNIKATKDFEELAWSEAEISEELKMAGENGELTLKIQGQNYNIPVKADNYQKEPTLLEKILHVFGWEKPKEKEPMPEETPAEMESDDSKEGQIEESNLSTNASSSNCTIEYGALMLINPNFTVYISFIAERKTELISLYSEYGIVEGVAGNGDNLLDSEAATHINDMVNAYKEAYPGHTLETRSCFRAVGTSCGRLCAATGASDHHTGLTCDLLDPVYGTSLDTSTYDQHLDWQWLRENSYKYGFIDRFPESWAGGLMSEPLNVDENGSTGLYETWHYRYVGIGPATEIATGKYNNGEYDSLEHYLKARGMIADLKNGLCK